MTRTTLIVQIEYDETVTDPEGLAVMMDRLLAIATSTPGILDDYNNPSIGEFLIGDE